jgi:pseudoazurin
MKNKIFLLMLPLCFMFIFNGKKYEEAVIDRLLVQVNICLEGQDCGSASQTSQAVASSPVEVQKVELSQGSEHEVKMLNSGEGGQMIFEPAVLKVSVGDTIHFKAVDMSHNSAVIDGMLPAGAEAWAGQMNMDISVTLDTEGVYVYQCDPHVMMAMIGVIQVGEATNMNDIKAATNTLKSSFVMNAERIDTYLSQL